MKSESQTPIKEQQFQFTTVHVELKKSIKSTHTGITAQNQTAQPCGLQVGVAGSNPNKFISQPPHHPSLLKNRDNHQNSSSLIPEKKQREYFG